MYFKNLNSVRFIAAAMVIVHHIEQAKELKGLPGYYDNSAILLAGKLGVIIFFALSGFLITSLLLKEQQQEGRIQLLPFYIRRALRIWPLYFLIVILAVLVWPFVPGMQIPGWADPYKHLLLNVFLLVFFLPNLQQFGIGPISFNGQNWSIGTEEQFYLFWPLIIGLGTRFKLERLIVGLLAIFLATKLAYYIVPGQHGGGVLWKVRDYLTNYSQFDCMMWGALFAVFHANGKGRAWLTNRYVQLLGYALFIGLALRGERFQGMAEGALYWDFYAILAGLLLYNLVQPTSIVNLEFRWLSRLGGWSYAMYMFHMIVIWLLIKVVGGNNILLYPLVFGCVITVAWLSYTYFEKPFLRLKDRFTVLKTTPVPLAA
jgi:peptidoglycan/LPS O-acetylase OafA/YrhL